MKSPVRSKDRDMQGVWPAMLRAAKKARELARATGTPFYVMRKGKIVDLNRPAKRSARKK
jgi:hypothetical protein